MEEAAWSDRASEWLSPSWGRNPLEKQMLDTSGKENKTKLRKQRKRLKSKENTKDEEGEGMGIGMGAASEMLYLSVLTATVLLHC